ncbi:phage tail assembly chaperone [Hyphomonas oceanitis]
MWRAALRAGVGPEDFWRLSVREWRWLAGAGEGMSGTRLGELMAAFPDGAPAFAGDTENSVSVSGGLDGGI